jgi:hypothetical protein
LPRDYSALHCALQIDTLTGQPKFVWDSSGAKRLLLETWRDSGLFLLLPRLEHCRYFGQWRYLAITRERSAGTSERIAGGAVGLHRDLDDLMKRGVGDE